VLAAEDAAGHSWTARRIVVSGLIVFAILQPAVNLLGHSLDGRRWFQVIGGVLGLLELESEIEVVAESANGDEALAMARKHNPDLVVLDIEMPGPSGIDVASQLTGGQLVVDPALATAALAQGDSPLTDREAEVLSAAAGHDAIADVAARLHLSPGTVRNHLSAPIQKLGARNRAEAVEIAQQKGWL